MKFKVKVTLSVTKTFTYDIEAAKQTKAEDAALDKAIADFIAATNSRHDHTDDDMEIETEKLTNECERCGKEYTVPSNDLAQADSGAWKEDQDFCAGCGAEIEAEDKDAAAHEEGAQS